EKTLEELEVAPELIAEALAIIESVRDEGLCRCPFHSTAASSEPMTGSASSASANSSRCRCTIETGRSSDPTSPSCGGAPGAAGAQSNQGAAQPQPRVLSGEPRGRPARCAREPANDEHRWQRIAVGRERRP